MAPGPIGAKTISLGRVVWIPISQPTPKFSRSLSLSRLLLFLLLPVWVDLKAVDI